MSVKVPDGSVKANGRSCVADWPAIGRANTGASLTLATVSMKPPLTETLLLSVAVTSRLSEPTSALAGVPLKVRVAASKASHDGSAAPGVPGLVGASVAE